MTEKSLEQQFVEAPDFIKQLAMPAAVNYADGIKKLADEGLVKPLPDGYQFLEIVPGLLWLGIKTTESD